MTTMFSLLLLLWPLFAGHVTVHQVVTKQFVDLYGNVREERAATSCNAGHVNLWFAQGLDLASLVHEAAHAYDCVDNGVMDGSPTSRPAVRPTWVSDYCWDSDAEWYACSVVYYRSVHPVSPDATRRSHHDHD